LTNPVPDFDAETRRRWYAVSLGSAGATALIGILVISVIREGVMKGSEDPAWQIAIAIFGSWLVFFLFKFIAAYALWYKPYATRRRAVLLSLGAILIVYLCLAGAGLLFGAMRGLPVELVRTIRSFWEFQKITYGLPYIAAALVGWTFARPAPDARDSF